MANQVPSATIGINGAGLGTSLQQVLMVDEIVPGSDPSYEACKVIYAYHPLGKKMADKPITMAQSQPRKISFRETVPDEVGDAFKSQWGKDGSDKHIFNLMRLSRVFGIASLALRSKENNAQPINYKDLWKESVSWACLDPLNTAGSLVLNQDPNADDFQTVQSISVNGKNYHPSRAVVIMNEQPLYIEYTASAFGFVGRSVYQRALYSLKSYIQTMITNQMVARKGGLLIAKMKAAGSVVDNMMMKMFGFKRDLLKQAETNNVLTIDVDEEVVSLDLVNVEAATSGARKNIIEDIALAADMPAKLLNQESFAEGFGEGVEDSKDIATYIDQIRSEMSPAYVWMDNIIQFRAWSPEFFETMKAKYADEYGGMTFEEAFYKWQNAFVAEWPSFLREPDSLKAEVEDVKFTAVVGLAEVLLPQADPENKAAILEWITDVVTECKFLFPAPLVLDPEAMATYQPPVPGGEKGEGEEKGESGVTRPPNPPRADSAFASYRAAFLRTYPRKDKQRDRRDQQRRGTA